MTRRKLVAGNWKLHLGPSAAGGLATALRERLDALRGVDVAVFPTALSVHAVVQALDGCAIRVGVQMAHAEAKGAYTGCNSAEIAREAGCDWLLAGHSEVRRDLAESDERVGASVRAGLRAGLLPMMCVGESLDERRGGRLAEVLERQLGVGLAGLHADEVATCTIAYEPIWAIGTGVVASPEQAQEAHAFVRGWLRATYPAYVAEQTRVLYGGSVTAANAATLLALPDVDGCLVGGASLKPDELAAIARAGER